MEIDGACFLLGLNPRQGKCRREAERTSHLLPQGYKRAALDLEAAPVACGAKFGRGLDTRWARNGAGGGGGGRT